MAKKTLTISKARERTKIRWRRWVRAVHANEYGFCKCITCGDQYAWDGGKMHAGHFIHGRNIVYFHPMNCWPQCYRCNAKMLGNGRPRKYANVLAKRFGTEKVQWLLEVSEQRYDFPRLELDRIYEETTAQFKFLGVSAY